MCFCREGFGQGIVVLEHSSPHAVKFFKVTEGVGGTAKVCRIPPMIAAASSSMAMPSVTGARLRAVTLSDILVRVAITFLIPPACAWTGLASLTSLGGIVTRQLECSQPGKATPSFLTCHLSLFSTPYHNRMSPSPWRAPRRMPQPIVARQRLWTGLGGCATGKRTVVPDYSPINSLHS